MTQTVTLDANAPAFKTELLGTPVSAARAWSTALTPNARGGWNFITQIYEYQYGKKSDTPAEYAVVDLQTGKYTLHPGRPGAYTNSNYQYNVQARAANGRIFFSEAGGFVAYYDPKDEKVHDLGQVADKETNPFIYRWTFGPDGKLYGGTQSKGHNLPIIVRIDPETLEYKTLGQVGEDNNPPIYAYYLVPDPTPSPDAPEGWVYVAVGQNPWKLVALNIATGKQKILATRADAGWMNFNRKPEGATANLITGLRRPDAKYDRFWLADGQMFPLEATYDPAKLPFKPRDVQPKTGDLDENKMPEIDRTQLDADSNGVCRIFWRPAGSAAETDWQEVQFKEPYVSPIRVESLLALSDGTVLGNAVQYHGFFRYDPKTQKTDFYGPHGPSRGPRVEVDGKVYITGYPNGVLYVYDPVKPWTANHRLETREEKGDLSAAELSSLNPRKLGNFAAAGAHYAYFLLPSKNGRLYYGGRRERDGTGGGVGWFDPQTQTFNGHYEGLSTLTPRGMVVLDDIDRVVYSGEVTRDPMRPDDKPDAAQLVVMDRDLKEVERLTVKPGLKNTGALFSAGKDQVIGVIGGDKFIYRYDITQKKLLDWIELPEKIDGASRRDADGSLWIVVGSTLLRLDPATMQVKTIGQLPQAPDLMAWQDGVLYFNSGAEFYRARIED
jgi:hypothetical protein